MERLRKKLKVGDWVEVRSSKEILRTLDEDGRLEGMPFMPEMFRYCGRALQVYKRAHKTCDPFYPVSGRWVDRCVHLNLRCDGSAHDGCQAGCELFWKEAWLRPISESVTDAGSKAEDINPLSEISEGTSRKWTRLPSTPGCKEPKYVCQATQLYGITRQIKWWNLRQYIEDY